MSGPLFIRTVPNRGEQEPSAISIDALAAKLGMSTLQSQGVVGDGVADDTEGMLRAAYYLNQAPFRALLSIGQNIRMSVPFPTILQSEIALQGFGSRITQTGNNGNIFTVGTPSLAVGRVKIHGFQFNWTGTPSPDDFLIDWVNAFDSDLRDFQLFNCPSIARFGSATTLANGCWLTDFRGNCNKGGLAQNNILIQNAVNFHIHNFKWNGPGMGTPQAGLYNTMAQIAGAPAVIRIKAVAGSAVDTGWITHGSIQFFTTSTPPASADGKPIAIMMDRTLGNFQNITVADCASAIDHTTTYAVALIDNNGAQVGSVTDRDVNILNNRMATDSGGGILVDFSQPTPTLAVRGLNIDGNFVIISDDTHPGIAVRGQGPLQSWSLVNNKVTDDHPSSAKTYAYSIGASDGIIANNHAGSSSNVDTNVATAFNFEHPDMDQLTFTGNRGDACPTFLHEPAYTVASAARRIEHDRAYTVATVASKASPKNIGSKIILTDGASNKKECIADGTIFRYHDGTAV